MKHCYKPTLQTKHRNHHTRTGGRTYANEVFMRPWQVMMRLARRSSQWALDSLGTQSCEDIFVPAGGVVCFPVQDCDFPQEDFVRAVAFVPDGALAAEACVTLTSGTHPGPFPVAFFRSGVVFDLGDADLPAGATNPFEFTSSVQGHLVVVQVTVYKAPAGEKAAPDRVPTRFDKTTEDAGTLIREDDGDVPPLTLARDLETGTLQTLVHPGNAVSDRIVWHEADVGPADLPVAVVATFVVAAITPAVVACLREGALDSSVGSYTPDGRFELVLGREHIREHLQTLTGESAQAHMDTETEEMSRHLESRRRRAAAVPLPAPLAMTNQTSYSMPPPQGVVLRST
jgi:hypothetical protein